MPAVSADLPHPRSAVPPAPDAPGPPPSPPASRHRARGLSNHPQTPAQQRQVTLDLPGRHRRRRGREGR
ncbi:hypothetical protein [Ktedonobacter sp. SOSP1-85]|uniref:hypothetical protein n=1 Tax=Ktedonobacter sp. SOSP1-85 TaxID=2778367 RepID=UPI001916A879|nr:hypothetical protein [Ktedonobacter sp. SOSP1-85]